MAIIHAYRGAGNNGKTYPAIKLTKKDPSLAAMVAKSERGMQPVSYDSDGNRRAAVTNAYAFRSILQKRAKRNNDAAAILKLLPDLELSSQILVSSILSPKDMMSLELIYTSPANLLTAELSGSMLNRLKAHFEDSYKIKPLLHEMIKEALCTKGSYPIAVIPENAIDEMINGSKHITMESLGQYFKTDGKAKNIGILGAHDTEKKSRLGVSFENLNGMSLEAIEKIDPRVHYKDIDGQIPDWSNYTAEEFLIVTDNPNVLKIPKINAKTEETIIRNKFNKGNLPSKLDISLEDKSIKINDTQVERAIFRRRQHNSEPVVTAKSQFDLSRKTVGNPLVMKLPTESVLPVHVPGNPQQHIGYFILLDENGNPISMPEGDMLHPGLGSDSANSVSSNLIKKVGMNMGTNNDSFDPLNTVQVNFAQQVYADMVERDLISRVKNGVCSSSVAIAKNEEIYRLMLARVLAKKYTQILYLPMEYLTYIAFKYGDDGVGRSLLDDQSMINTLRTVLMFSDMMASVKNSIGRTKISGTIPETDPNPLKTIETIMDEIVRSRTLGIPLGVSNPADIMEFIQRAGFEWDIGGHKGIPDLKLDFQQIQTSYAKPDTELTDHLRKASIMGFGLSPETVDNGFNAEFATTAVANNILLSKRVVMWQDIFVPQLSNHLRQVAMHTSSIVDELRQILEDNVDNINLTIEDIDAANDVEISEDVKKKLIVSKALRDFINGFEVTLPRPSSVTLENQLNELKTYTDALDIGLDAYITSDLFAEVVVGELTNEAGTIRALLKAYFVRQWLSDKGILPELSEMVTSDENGNPQLAINEQIKTHLEAMSKAGILSLVSLQPNKAAVNKDLNESGVVVGDNAGDAAADGFGSSSDGGSSGGGFDDLGGMGFDDMPEDESLGTPIDESVEGNSDAVKTDETNPSDKPADDTPVE